MLVQPDTPAKSVYRNPLLYSSVVLVGAALAVSWILLSRWEETQNIENRAKEKKARQEQEQDRISMEQLGGRDLAIQNFYASAGAIYRGQSVQLCYGVANAKSVKLEPQPNPVWPSNTRCVKITPSKTTIYTLTITGAAGDTKTQSLEVIVR